MNAKPVRTPGPDHPISITPTHKRVVVSVAGRAVARTDDALTLQEAHYPPVFYVPRKDVDMSQLQRTSHQTYCPFKGECTYFSIPTGGSASTNAVWSYEAPHPAVAQIRDYLAFYPDRVEAIDVI